MLNGKENPLQTEKTYEAEGVVILLFNPEGKVFLVAEKEDNPKSLKKKDELGVPCETMKEGESYMETAIRGLKEELGLSMADIMENIRVEDNNRSYLGKTPFRDGKCLAHIVALHVLDQRKFELKVNADNEVEYGGWDWLETAVAANPQSRIHVFLSPFVGQEGLLNRASHKHELVRFIYQTKDKEGEEVWWLARNLKRLNHA